MKRVFVGATIAGMQILSRDPGPDRRYTVKCLSCGDVASKHREALREAKSCGKNDCYQALHGRPRHKRREVDGRIRCPTCGKDVPTDGFRMRGNGYVASSCHSCEQKRFGVYGKEYEKRRRSLIKAIVFQGYGSRCACCGCDDEEVLQLDHVNNDGAEERQRIRSSDSYVLAIAEGFPGRYQLLCANCNFSKMKNKVCLCRASRAKQPVINQLHDGL